MLARTAHVLATGYLLFFFSERLFWSVFRASDSVGDALLSWLAYCAPGYLLLAVVHGFGVSRLPAVFLAGTVYGWLVEGCLASTLYGTQPSAPFPVSILCTAASWHALISVVVGWHLLRNYLLCNGLGRSLWLSVAVGVFWGLWAPFQWQETPPVVTSPGAFLLGGLAITLPLVLSCWLTLRPAGQPFAPGRVGLVVSGLVLAVFYAQQVATVGLLALGLLPTLLGLAGALLWIGRQRTASPAPRPPERPVTLRRCLVLLVMPLVATATYGLALGLRPHWPSLQVPLFVGLTVLGGLGLAGSAAVILWGAWVQRRART